MVANDPVNKWDLLGMKYNPQEKLTPPKNAKDCAKTIYIFVGGFFDDTNGNVKWAKNKWEKDKNKGTSPSAYFHWDGDSYFRFTGTGDNVKNINEYKKCCKKTNIVMIGHSFGGDTAMDMSAKIKKHNGKLVLVTLDPVSQMDIGQLVNLDRDKNIDYWVNSYVEKGVGNWLSGVPVVTSLWGATVGSIESIFTDRDASDAIAAIGGHWGHENSADINIEFKAGTPSRDKKKPNYKATHAYAPNLLMDKPSASGKSALDYVKDYLK